MHSPTFPSTAVSPSTGSTCGTLAPAGEGILSVSPTLSVLSFAPLDDDDHTLNLKPDSHGGAPLPLTFPLLGEYFSSPCYSYPSLTATPAPSRPEVTPSACHPGAVDLSTHKNVSKKRHRASPKGAVIPSIPEKSVTVDLEVDMNLTMDMQDGNMTKKGDIPMLPNLPTPLSSVEQFRSPSFASSPSSCMSFVQQPLAHSSEEEPTKVDGIMREADKCMGMKNKTKANCDLSTPDLWEALCSIVDHDADNGACEGKGATEDIGLNIYQGRVSDADTRFNCHHDTDVVSWERMDDLMGTHEYGTWMSRT